MAPPFCCGFRHHPSPESEPIHLIDTMQTKGRFPLSSHSASSTSSPVAARPTQERFSSASRGEDNDGIPTVSDSGLPPLRQMARTRRSSSSIHRFHEAVRHIQKRVSRDSGLSNRSSKQRPRSSMSKEDVDRRDELKRALQERVRADIIEDDYTFYDEDAVPIKTPATTWGRHEGIVQISPKQLSNVMRRSQSPLASAHDGGSHVGRQSVFTGENTTATLSRMLTQRASHLADDSDEYVGGDVDVTIKRSKTTKKYIFIDEASPADNVQNRSPSPLGRSNTVIHVRPTAQPDGSDLLETFSHDNIQSPPSPELLPQLLASTNGSIAEPDSRLSLSGRISETRRDSLPVTLADRNRQPAVGPLFKSMYDTKIRPASEQWLHGTSGRLGDSIHHRSLSDEGNNRKRSMIHGYHCSPSDEEMGFGGIDGGDDSPPYSAFLTARNSSEDSEPHMYNTHIPLWLKPKSILPAISSPQLQGYDREVSYNMGDSSEFSVIPQPKRHASSPRIMPMAWDNYQSRDHQPRESSSIYSSQPESHFSSRRNSSMQGTTLVERFQQDEDRNASDGIISIYASRPQSINLDQFERREIGASFHSSNESLIAKERAAAERRVQPVTRARTLPYKSRFKEELQSISDEIALTIPPRRRASNLDGSDDHQRASLASLNNKAANSIWDKALREHSHEDALLAHTRLGSNSPGTNLEVDEGPLSKKKAPSRPSLERHGRHHGIESWSGSSLQARLAAYELPPPSPPPPTPMPMVESRGRGPTIEKDLRSASTGSWSRYPSHSRPERGNSPAGTTDQVFARDFADMVPGTPSGMEALQKGTTGSGRSSGMAFHKDILGSIKRVYRAQSQELQRRLANEARGHRSSISTGGVLEYPELEMVGSISPPMPSPDIKTKTEMAKLLRQGSPLGSARDASAASEVDGAGRPGERGKDEARVWSDHYRDCVNVPVSPSEGFGVTSSAGESSEGFEYKDLRSGRHELGLGSNKLGASTLESKRSVELDERRAKTKVEELVDGIDSR